MKKHFILILLVIVCMSMAYGQKYTIKGQVFDAITGEKMMFANCVLHYKTDTAGIYKGAVSDTAGKFSIKGVKKRDMILEVTYVGYASFKKDIPLNDFGKDLVISFDSIKIMPLSILGLVEIKATRPRIEIDDDKMFVNIDEQMATTVTNAFELLRLVPGVMIDNDENIQLNGQSGVQFQYNSRDLKMGWSAIKDMLKGMAPEMVDQFEVLKNPGVKYDAEGTAGIINIRMRKDQHYGINGSVGVSVGRTDKYTYNLSPSGRLNFVNDKWIISGGYSHGVRWYGKEDFKDSSQRFTWLNNDTTMFRRYAAGNKSKNRSENVDFSASYSLDTSSTLSFDAYASWDRSPWQSNMDKGLMSHNPNYYIADSMYNTYKGDKSKGNNFSMSLGYVKKLDTLDSKLSSDLSFSYNKNLDNEQYLDKYYYSNIPTDENFYRQDGYLHISSQKTTNASWRMDLYKPFTKTMILEAGVKTNFNYNDRDYQSYSNNIGELVNNIYETNRFKYLENVNSFYANFTSKFFDKKLSLRAGIRLEQTNTKGEQIAIDSTNTRHYFNIFPNIRVGYKFSDDNEININYSYRISRPWSWYVNPFLVKQQAYLYMAGDPYIKPQYSHEISLEHSWKYMLFSSVSYSYSNDIIQYLTFPMDSTMLPEANSLYTVGKPCNFGHRQDVDFDLSFNKPITMSWYVTARVGVNYSNQSSNNLRVNASQDIWSWNTMLSTFATLPYKIRVSAYYMYYGSQLWGTSKSNGFQWLMLSIGKEFFEQLSFYLSFNWQMNQKYHSTNKYLNMKSESWSSARNPYFGLSVRYKFGKMYENKQVKKQQLENFDSRATGQPSTEQH